MNAPNIARALQQRVLKFVNRGLMEKGLTKGLTTVYLIFSKAPDAVSLNILIDTGEFWVR